MQDRLGELKARQSGYAEFTDHAEAGDNSFMPTFFTDVDSIKAGLNQLQNQLGSLKEKQTLSLSVVSQDQSATFSHEIESLTEVITKKSVQVKNQLKKLKEELAKVTDEKHSTEKRLRENMHGALTRKFVDLMKQYQEGQALYKAKFRERVERQMKVVAPEATAEEIEKIVDSGGAGVFAQNILQKKATDAEEALDYVKQRNEEIKNLEKSITDLHGLFVDMQLLVENQNELLDQIEFSVAQSEQHVEESHVVLSDAVAYQNSARKKILIIIILTIICLAIIIIPLVIYFK